MPEEGSENSEICLRVCLHNVVMAGVLGEKAWPSPMGGRRMSQACAMVRRNDIIYQTVHDEGRATHASHVPVVVEEVEARVDTRWPTTSIRLRVKHLDSGDHRRVQDDSAQPAPGGQMHRRSAADALPVSDDALGRHAALDDKLVGRLHVSDRVRCARRPSGGAVPGVLDADHLDAQATRQLEVRSHHEAYVGCVPVAMQQDERPCLRSAIAGQRRVGRS
mmetsp:Transcript_42672/g.123331  ORF Transcript_42672/g.123331 Transcript_42672/m.123331 type:complete len:220 (+) Transcript_42672:356-1015(+)